MVFQSALYRSAWVRGALLMAIGVPFLAQMANAERRCVSLNDGWEFRQRLEEPGAVQAAWHPA